MSTDAPTRTARPPGTDRTGSSRGARDRLALPGAALAALGVAVTGDPVGIAAGVILLLAWILAPPVALATLGAFLFVTVQPGGPLGLLAAAGLALVLLGPIVRSAEPTTALLATAAVAIALGAVAIWTTAAVSLTAAAGALVLVTALIGYGVHRYGVVTVEQGPTSEEVTSDG